MEEFKLDGAWEIRPDRVDPVLRELDLSHERLARLRASSEGLVYWDILGRAFGNPHDDCFGIRFKPWLAEAKKALELAGFTRAETTEILEREGPFWFGKGFGYDRIVDRYERVGESMEDLVDSDLAAPVDSLWALLWEYWPAVREYHSLRPTLHISPGTIERAVVEAYLMDESVDDERLYALAIGDRPNRYYLVAARPDSSEED